MACSNWGSDVLIGGTPSASTDQGALYVAAKAVDDDTDTHWLSKNDASGKVPTNPQWWKYDFGGGNAKKIEKVLLTCKTPGTGGPEDFKIQGSNNDSDWDDLDVQTGLSWTNKETKDFEFINSTAYRYLKIYITDADITPPDAQLCIWEIEAFQCTDKRFDGIIIAASSAASIHLTGGQVESALIDGAGLDDTVDALGPVLGDLTDQTGIDDTIDVSGGSQTVDISDAAGFSDLIDPDGVFGRVLIDQAGFDDSIDALNTTAPIADSCGIGDWINGGLETQHVFTDQAGFDDSIDCLNWSEFLRENQDRYLIKYFCTITGAADDTTDIEIPIEQFQARKRDGEATYLSVVVPSHDNAGEIADRSNGQVIIQMAYFVGGVEQLREEILRVDLENIRTDEGPVNRSVTLSGHLTESYGGQIATLENPIYKYTSEGIRRFRFAAPDPWINPGDTIKVGDDEFRVGYITYVVGERFRQMEVTEA